MSVSYTCRGLRSKGKHYSGVVPAWFFTALQWLGLVQHKLWKAGNAVSMSHSETENRGGRNLEVSTLPLRTPAGVASVKGATFGPSETFPDCMGEEVCLSSRSR